MKTEVTEDLKITKKTIQIVLNEYDNVMSKLLKIYESGNKDFGSYVFNLFEEASDNLYNKGINATTIIFITRLSGFYTEVVENLIKQSVRPVDEREWKAFQDIKLQDTLEIMALQKREKIDFFS